MWLFCLFSRQCLLGAFSPAPSSHLNCLSSNSGTPEPVCGVYLKPHLHPGYGCHKGDKISLRSVGDFWVCVAQSTKFGREQLLSVVGISDFCWCCANHFFIWTSSEVGRLRKYCFFFMTGSSSCVDEQSRGNSLQAARADPLCITSIYNVSISVLFVYLAK